MQGLGQRLGLATLASGLALATGAPALASDSGEQVRGGRMGGQVHRPMMRPPQMHGGHRFNGGHRWTGGHRWGQRHQGRWHAGYGAPGGWGGYRFAYSGYQLPSYWIAPSYVIGWQTYSLPQPRSGYNWSRYYDDAVLIDGEGRVIDTRRGIDWDRYEGGYEDSEYAYSDDDGYVVRRRDGAGGAVAGAVVGGIAGNVIAGRGNRLAGTALGAGIGAAAGYAIDRAEDQRRAPPPGAPYPYAGDRYDRYDDGPDGPPPGVRGPGHHLPAPADYGWDEEVVASGTWTGTWTGRTEDGRPYNYTGSFDGQYRGDAPGATYPMPSHGAHHDRGPRQAYYAPVHNPAIVPGGAATVMINGVAYPAGGHVTGGYYYPPATVTSVTVQTHPVTTTRTVVERVRTRHAPRRRHAPAKPRCHC